jgi:hypothetical protein
MRQADVAEWLLSMTTTPERAASTAGDLVEEAATRGSLWFWSSLIRTSASLMWRMWADNPRRMAWLVARAMLINALLSLSIGLILTAFAFGIVIQLRVHGFSQFDSEPYMKALSQVIGLGCGFFVGKWLAWRAPGRELPACAGYFLLTMAVGASVVFALGATVSLDLPAILSLVAQVIALFAGVDRVRKRSRA